MGMNHYRKILNSLFEEGTGPGCDFVRKSELIEQYVGYMLIRTQAMFRWSGLPDMIPQRNLELMLQINGFVAVAPVDGSLYALVGGLGGYANVYYEPTVVTIANPALRYNKVLTLGTDCALVRNDALMAGLMPMYYRYAAHLAETDLSINLATINSRLIAVLTAPDDRTREAALKLLEDIKEGRQGVVLSPSTLLDEHGGMRSLPYSNASDNSTIKNLIELTQYLRASWYNEMGLNANWNAKRESLSAAESLLNDDALLPLVDDMLACRRKGAEEINRLYGTSITVDLASSWEDNQIEIGQAQQEQGDQTAADSSGEEAADAGTDQ